jgi:hypothetical protein
LYLYKKKEEDFLLLFINVGKGRLHNFNYGLYWPLWDVICGTRYRENSSTNDDNHSPKIKEHTEKKIT